MSVARAGCEKNSVSSWFHFRTGKTRHWRDVRETVDLNTRADLRIDFITKSCDNDS